MAERRVAHLEPQHGVPASISDPTPALMAVNGPYWEEGLDFEGVPPSEPMRRCLENRHPISLHVPPHYRRHIIENNVLMLFGMINYYDHFWDDPNFLYIVAIDLEWDPDVCAAIVARYEKARNQFLTKPQRSNLSPHASNIAARIRLLVDNWRLREVRQWPMTTNRMRFIDSTRLHWRSIMEDDPESLVLHSPSLPYIHPVKCDWMHPVQAALSSRIATEDRQRSRSPPPCILRGNLRRSRTPPAPRSDAFLSRYQARHLRLLNREKTRAAVAKEKSSNRDSREEVKHEVENEIVSEAVQNDGYVRVEQDYDRMAQRAPGPVSAALLELISRFKQLKRSGNSPEILREYATLVRSLEASAAQAAKIDSQVLK